MLSHAEPGSVRAAAAAVAARAAASRSTACCATSTGVVLPGHHALAAPVLLRLLPRQRQRPRDPRRPALLRPRRAGHAVGDLARGHRARDARARLDGRAARPARAGSGPTGAGGGVIQHTASDATLVALLAALHRVSGGRTERARRRRRARYAVYTSTQTHSSVEKACRIAGLGADARAQRRRRPGDPRHAARRTCAARSSATSAAGVAPALVVRHGRHDRHRRPRPVPELGRDRARARRLAARRRGVGRRRRGRAGAPVDQRRRGAASTPTAPTRTSGCSPTSTATLFWVADRAALHRRAVDPARVPAQRRDRVRRGHRLPRLAGAARPALPRAQAVVRARWYGAEGLRAHIRGTSRWPRSSPAGSRRRAFDVAPASVLAGLPRPRGATTWTPTSRR